MAEPEWDEKGDPLPNGMAGRLVYRVKEHNLHLNPKSADGH
jgi:hypothetical protein